MNRRSILGIAAMTVFALALVPGSTLGQQKSLKDQLVGTWILVSTQTTSPSGVRYPYGTDPRGIMILDVSGDTRPCKGEAIAPN